LFQINSNSAALEQDKLDVQYNKAFRIFASTQNAKTNKNCEIRTITHTGIRRV